VAGSSGGPTVESVTELGAHIDGITVFHAATGLSMEYVTNPMVGVQTCSDCCTVTFTGEKLTISGMPFCCLEEVTTTFYVTCAGGFEYVRFDLQGIDVPAWPWLLFDASLTFEVDEKALAIAPTLRLGEWTCIDLYTELSSLNPLLFDGVRFYGLGLTCTLGDVTLKSLSVFDTGRHAITTPTYGSVIESLADAVAAGHTYYPDYWELFSIEVVGDGCCGTQYRFLANTYFDAASAMLFDWGMSHMEVTLPLNPEFMLTGSLEVSEAGLEWFGVGLTFTF